MAAARPVVRNAPAKINLYLHVVGRRRDGYHLLDSLVAFADIGDRVEVRAASDLALAVDGPFAAALAAERNNLVLRAARLLREAGDVAGGSHIRLHKALPVASGIGGGSADAAATLQTLLELWRLTLDPARLQVLALELGADVPVCLHGRPAVITGIGEHIAAVAPLPRLWLVLVNPGFALATADVFRSLAGRVSAPPPPWPPITSTAALLAALSARRNDLEAPALACAPALAEVLAALRQAPEARLVRMSGSGATCFAVFDDQPAAARAAAALGAAHPRWWVRAASVLG